MKKFQSFFNLALPVISNVEDLPIVNMVFAIFPLGEGISNKERYINEENQQIHDNIYISQWEWRIA